MRYTAARLLHAVFLLFALSVLTFVLANLAPGDYYSDWSTTGTVSPHTIETFRARAGLNRPMPARYASWAASMLRGDFGNSLMYNGPVAPLLWTRAANTLLLTAPATLIAWLIAIPLGVWSAARARSWTARAADVLWTVLLATPDLLLAILLLVFAVETGWFPAGGMETEGAATRGLERTRDIAWHLVLPILVLLLGMLPFLVRHVRASMLDAISAPLGLNARAQGIPSRRLLFAHLLPAAANPLVSLFGLSVGTLLSMSLLVEIVMGWPGLGPFLLDGIMNRDLAVVLSVVMISAAFLISGNLVGDLLLYRLDPRIRRGKTP
jgi:peptide/nickel transport system permease protein